MCSGVNTILDHGPNPFVIVPPTLDVVQDLPIIWDGRLLVACLVTAFFAWYLF